ncbi:DJ-1/PfpI family protein [Sanguibacter gelidistatuariae]|uniref:DJ-1/PfpI family protein n=1 Tax=Sanguibacter gelidistatuariae TaxID=1814289 RepID=A0A1G6GWY9_9MICO|nr:DJ-1/PfpI family protein [Sanguibacter gelidistatuariae]SDB86185.1 DJ-1/PfpI family protein [Sanguibacter gelidistatuariae]
MKTIVLYATATMADWEYGYLTAGLAMSGKVASGDLALVVAADGSAGTVTTMGGLTIVPDSDLADLDTRDIAALVLPGANTWGQGHAAALRLAGDCKDSGILVAAICGATLGLARAGLLNDRDHTSNAPEFLAHAAEYTAADRYQATTTVSDRGVITAPATAPIDFARAVFEHLDLFHPATLDAWYGLYTTGEKKYFEQLQQADQ